MGNDDTCPMIDDVLYVKEQQCLLTRLLCVLPDSGVWEGQREPELQQPQYTLWQPSITGAGVTGDSNSIMASNKNTGQLYCLSLFCCLAPKFYLTLENPWTIAHKPPLSVGFPRQEYWSGLPFPSPEDLPDLEIELLSPTLTGGFFTTESQGKPCLLSLSYLLHSNNTGHFLQFRSEV